MTRTHRRTATLLATTGLALGLGLGGLSACSQADPAPKFAEEPSASPTPEAKETAEEFIRRWNDELTAMQKGDTREYREIAGACEPCMSAADKVDEYYAAGGYVATKGRKILSIKASDELVGVETYLVKVRSAPTEYKTTAAGPVERFDGGVVLFRVELGKKGDEWRLINTVQVPS